MYPLIILAGPTASGKSETALELAEYLDSEIISADSMQVYKYFDIGTAKPSQDIRRRLPHHLIDIREPDEGFNAFEFKTLALKETRRIKANSKIPIIVGGTGLYLKTLMEGFDCATQGDPEIREKVKSKMATSGPEKVYERLAQVDPAYAQKISPTDLVRIERAYSVFLETGRPFSQFHEEESSKIQEFEPHLFVFHRDRKELYKNIERRINFMIAQGWIEEVAELLNRGFHRNLRPFQSIGYSKIGEHVENERPITEVVNEIKKETRNYAKRQMTWFRNTPEAKTLLIDTKDSPTIIKNRILSHLPHLIGVVLAMVFNLSSHVFAETTPPFIEGVKWFGQSDFVKAEKRFQDLSRNDVISKERPKAFYLLGLTRKEQKKFSAAIEAFQSALKAYPAIEDYIRFRLAESYIQREQYAFAVKHLNVLLTSYPKNRFSVDAELLRAEAMEKLGRHSKALQTLNHAVNRLSRNGSRSPDRLPYLIYKLGQLLEKARRLIPAYQTYKKLYLKYPTHSLLEKAEARLEALKQSPGFQLPPTGDGDYLIRLRRLLNRAQFEQVIEEITDLGKKQTFVNGQFYVYKAQALQALDRRKAAHRIWKMFLKRYPVDPKRQKIEFQLARNLWNMGQDEEATKRFQKLANNQPTSEWTIKARYFQGRALQGRGLTKDAIEVFRLLESQSGEKEENQKAAWRIGWLYYLNGHYEKALQQFQKNIQRFPEGLMIESNLYWLGKSFDRKNLAEHARQTYQQLHFRYPYRYYGIRARTRLNQDENAPWKFKDHVKLTAPRSEAPMARPSLNSKANRRYQRALDMIDMNLMDNARYEIRQMEPYIRKNYSGTLWLAKLYNQVEAYGEGYRVMEFYQNYKTKKGEKDLPYSFWSLYFPLAYGKIIQANSEKYGIDSYFINSIIRQESRFDSRSFSGAGARGLMQIMPDTEKRLHEPIKTQSFEPDPLFRPILNIRLGAKYLGQLKKHYQNNLIHILICYNAGPEVLKRWQRRFQHIKDIDTFIESIPYPETQQYVKRVLRNYGVYQMLY